MTDARLKMNLEVLTRSRRWPEQGQVFVIKPKNHAYYFGRVIDPSIKMLKWNGILVYIYQAHSYNKKLVPLLSKEHLLIPPDILDHSCWTRGLIETIGKSPIEANDLLRAHCFKDVAFNRFVDQHGRVLPGRAEPCGVYGITPFLGLDNLLSRALGIPEILPDV
jgi:hypothetical protein